MAQSDHPHSRKPHQTSNAPRFARLELCFASLPWGLMENIIILNIHILVYLGHGPGGENSPHDEVATDANHSADAIPEVPVQQPNVPPEGLAVNNKVPSRDEFKVEVVSNDPVDRGAENAVKSNIDQVD